MDDLTLILLLPIVFMIHEFEEMILFPYWIPKHTDEFKRRYPRWYSKLKLEQKFILFQTPAFILAVFEEFILISAGTLLTVVTGNLIYWYFCLLAFTLHFAGHILLPIVLKKICSGTHYNSYMFTILCMGYLFCAQLFFDASTSLYRIGQSIVFYSKSTHSTKHCFQATQTAHPIIGEALISQFGQSPL